MKAKTQTVARRQPHIRRPGDSNRFTSESDFLRRKWVHSAQLGGALILLGIIVLATIRTNAMAHAPLLGWLIVASGAAELVYALRIRGWRGFFLHLIPGIVSVPIGLLVATQPVDPTAWTLTFASFLIVIGLFRMIAAVRVKFGQWIWAVVDGTVSLIFGILLWARSPWLSFRYLGIAMGISLIMRGWSSLVFALSVRGSRALGPTVSIEHAKESPQVELPRGPRNKDRASA